MSGELVTIAATGNGGGYGEWRYFRVIKRFARASTVDEMAWLRASWGPTTTMGDGLKDGNDPLPQLLRVPWLPYNVYRMPKTVYLSQSTLHKDGQIVGMDAASVASIVALDIRAGQTVLDVCCCPGMKLKLASELAKGVGSSGGTGLTVGVDISLNRLFVARSLLTKLGADSTILAHCDGTRFSPESLGYDIALRRPPARQKTYLQRLVKQQQEAAGKEGVVDVSTVTSVWCSEDLQRALVESSNAVKRMRDADWDSGVLPDEDGSPLPLPFPIPMLYDRVLVDAECTHDGSLHHIVPEAGGRTKDAVGAAPAPPTSFQDSLHKYKPNYCLHTEEGDATLHDLQYRLLERGYSLTCSGGVVVYSTCSFSEGQNEGIVRRFLEAYGGEEGVGGHRAVLVSPFEGCLQDDADTLAALEGVADAGIDGLGVRMNPIKTQSSFQYIAKFYKRPVA